MTTKNNKQDNEFIFMLILILILITAALSVASYVIGYNIGYNNTSKFTEINIIKDAVKHGKGEFYLDNNYEKQFRWLDCVEKIE